MKRMLWLCGAAALLILAGCQEAATQPGTTPMATTEPMAGTASPLTAPRATSVPTTLTTPTAAETGIIVDDKDPGFKSEGTWNSATGDYFKGEVAWAEKDDTATATATWTAMLPSAGTYQVYEYHGENPSNDHATNAPFTIKYDGGSADVAVDETANIDKWNLLGTYKFAAGNATVTLTNKANGNVIADAVKFVKVK